MDATIKRTGIDVILKVNIDDIKTEKKAATLKVLKTLGMQIEGHAKVKCPVGTPESTGVPGYIGGTLRNSITHAVSGQKTAISSYSDNAHNVKGSYEGTAPDDEETAVYIGTNVYYAPYVELGARGKEARAFLKPAATEHSEEYKAIAEWIYRGN